MEKNWYFSLDYSIGDDFSDHGTEVFKNNNDGAEKFKKFAREMVQNSIDVKDTTVNDPLVVTFDLFEVDIDELPSFERLQEHIEGTIQYCESKNKLNNAYNNSKREIKYFSKKKIRILKISDYNTKGIVGSKNISDETSSWAGLIYNDGDSVKSSIDSLGSHGLGKGAAFALSNLRTVFYNTKDIFGTRALEGVSRQYVSYINGQKKFYKGFYGKIIDNKVLPFIDDEINEFSSIFERTSAGSDIFVIEPDVSFLTDETVKWYLIESIVCNFFVAIRDGNLELVVNGTEINQNNLEQIIGLLNTFYEKNSIEKSDMLIATEQYIYALEHSDPIVENVKEYGDIKLWLYKDNNTKWKNVAIIRKNGMFIKNLEVKYANQKFAGVVIVEGEEGVEFLKSIEDPSHMEFDPSRATNEKYGSTETKTKRLNVFYDWVKNHVKNFTKITSEEKFTLSGMEDYIQMPSTEEKVYNPQNMQPKVVKPKAKKIGKSRVAKKTGVEKVEDGTTQVIPDDPGQGGSNVPNPNPKPHESQEENKDSKKKGFVKTYIASYELGPVIKHNSTESILVFEITECDKNFKIKFNAVDEDGYENSLLPNIIYAYNINTGEELRCQRHIVYDVKCEGVMKIKVKFDSMVRTCIKPVIYWEE